MNTTPSNKKEQARALYSQSVSDGEIAERVGVSRRTIINWRNKDRGGDNDWDVFKKTVKPPEPEPAPRPKLINFESRRRDKEVTPPPVDSDYRTLNGRVQMVEMVLDRAVAEIRDAASPQTYGAAMAGFWKGMALLNELAPVNDEALLLQLMDRRGGSEEVIAWIADWGESQSA